MRHTIPAGNWTRALAAKIEQAQDGDEIVVHNEDMKELAESAKQRMCPNKRLVFVVEALPEAFEN